ncbi:hypothetical protein [Sinimarinibacterium sp. NLF-5-8]|uniref:hypothetical protein n=1 Tax=Sinimarinibacterium sp. NLF-5-8 TaxID=2698684 RepID=UPI00137C2C85|nr:hypothetical protein [Sinimarinibacterium sp. NLF-5-8]QHS09066.1 hypothetical protein GT972_02160 [Sinimarinibacterium sp. NLF-5-8]
MTQATEAPIITRTLHINPEPQANTEKSPNNSKQALRYTRLLLGTSTHDPSIDDRLAGCEGLAQYADDLLITDTLLMHANARVEPSPSVRVAAVRALEHTNSHSVPVLFNRFITRKTETNPDVIAAMREVGNSVMNRLGMEPLRDDDESVSLGGDPMLYFAN